MSTFDDYKKAKNMLTQARAQKKSLAQTLKANEERMEQLEKEQHEVIKKQMENEKNVEKLTMTLGNLSYIIPFNEASFPTSTVLRVSPLPLGVDKAAVLAVFKVYGAIRSVGGRGGGFGYINFDTLQHAREAAAALNTMDPFGHGQAISCHVMRQPPILSWLWAPAPVPPVAPPTKKRQRVDTPDDDSE